MATTIFTNSQILFFSTVLFCVNDLNLIRASIYEILGGRQLACRPIREPALYIFVSGGGVCVGQLESPPYIFS